MPSNRESSASAAEPATAAAAASSQRPRHNFTRSLSELSSPLRLRRQSQSQAPRDSPAPGQDSRSPPAQTNAAPTGPAATGPGAPQLPSLAPASPSQSPRLSPLGKSRTAGSVGASLTTAAALTGNFSMAPQNDALAPLSRTATASTTVSPGTSRRPSVHTGKDSHSYAPDEALLQPSQTQQPYALPHGNSGHRSSRHSPHSHSQSYGYKGSHSRSHSRIHRRHHNSTSTSSTGDMGGHSTAIAALAATATAVAAASPTTPASSLPATLHRAQTNTAGPVSGSEADRSPEDPLQQQERQASMASMASGASLPVDPAAVRAAAAALELMQRKQSRNAARVLQTAVADLDSLSATTSQRLDAAYGSVLARLGALQDTVLALRSLAAAARATNRRFTAEAESIAHEIDLQVKQLEDGGGGTVADGKEGREGGAVLTPADQQCRLEQLSARVARGRQAIKDLAERVERVRSRVACWELADQAWQERTRTRLKVLWVIVSGVVLLLAVLFAVMTRHPDGGSSPPPVDAATDSTLAVSGKPSLPPELADIVSAPASTGHFHLPFPNSSANSRAGRAGENTAAGEEADPLQRLFDEL